MTAQPIPGRYLHTGLTPHPIDLWAITRWNERIQTARDAYNTHMATQESGPLPRRWCATPGCRVRTNDETGICYRCRILADLTPCQFKGCTSRTRHASGYCALCRPKVERIRERLHQWYVCTRPGCGRATKNPFGICYNCRQHLKPSGPGDHWTLRYRAAFGETS